MVGAQKKAAEKVVKNCACTDSDFEWYVSAFPLLRLLYPAQFTDYGTTPIHSCSEFNHVRNPDGKCVLVSGTEPLPPHDSCRNGEDYWYERTAYRKIPYSTCEDGLALHQGTRHVCPGIRAHGAAFWFFVLVLPFVFTASVAWWYYRKSGLARGCVSLLSPVLGSVAKDADSRASWSWCNRMIRLPGDTRPSFSSDSGFMSTLASVPWFIVGLAGIAWERISSTVEGFATSMRSRRGYRNIPVDEDAQILRFEDEE